MSVTANEEAHVEDFRVIIPAFNEADSLPEVIEGLIGIVAAEKILVIDDGSTDNTAQIPLEYGVEVISHRLNKGYGSAILTGIQAANSEWVLLFDADGQHLPQSVPELWESRHDADMVVGVRSGGSPVVRRPGKAALAWLADYLAGQKFPDLNSGLRLLRREDALRFRHLYPPGFSFSTTVTLCYAESKLHIKWVDVQTERRTGRSQVRPVDAWNMFMVILRIICTFSPLKFFMPVSFMLGTGGLFFTFLELYISRGISDSAVLLLVAALIMFTTGLLADGVASLRKDLSK